MYLICARIYFYVYIGICLKEKEEKDRCNWIIQSHTLYKDWCDYCLSIFHSSVIEAVVTVSQVLLCSLSQSRSLLKRLQHPVHSSFSFEVIFFTWRQRTLHLQATYLGMGSLSGLEWLPSGHAVPVSLTEADSRIHLLIILDVYDGR